MIVGTSQLDITPQPGIDLVGFAARRQPSTGVLDPLAARALYLEDGSEKLLWLHVDLLAVEEPLVAEIRHCIRAELGIPGSRVLITATHTHGGPPTVHLTGCGDYNATYVDWLKERLLQAARSATANLEPCELVAVEGRCDLGIDRRGRASAHTDPRVAAVGWRRPDGTFKAVLLNYAMHGVCLRGSEITADWPGAAAQALSQSLPGQPTALVCTGACGNINPPDVGVSPEPMRRYGRQVAESVLPALARSPGLAPDAAPLLKVAGANVSLPVENWTAAEIAGYADRCLADPAGHSEFGEKYRLAVETWRESMMAAVAAGKISDLSIDLVAVALGPATFVAVNAEVFSRFNELLGEDGAHRVYAVGCTNGMIGYLPTAAAHDEGGYEVQWAMLFYNKLRPKRGGLERLAEAARGLLHSIRPET